MKKYFSFMLLLVVVVLSSCTQQSMSRNFGGSSTINLPKGQKLINITWKETELWYLTRPFKSTDEVETYQFKEDSNYGMLEGTVTIIESK
jgi:hypothetical protein